VVAAAGLSHAVQMIKVQPNVEANESNATQLLQQTPMAEVVMLIQGLAAKVEADGKAEQQSYDKYACWCEATLGRKAGDISEEKKEIEDLSVLLVKLSAEIAVHGSEIENLNKAVAANIASQKEATEVRAGENSDYTGEKIESEQCIGAMEAAIKVLNGAGAGKAGFLATMQEAQLLSVVAGVRGVLKSKTATSSISDSDLSVVHRFVERPEDFVGKSSSLSAVQIAQNPFGDYAPQSTQIQGILKGMYDAFAGDLEKENAEESEQEKAFRALMATKKAELATLQATLERHTLDKASKTKLEAESQQARDDEEAQLAADEQFFEETKQGCKGKATEWNERSRLRTEELQGMGKAVEILNGGAATFVNATTTFIQKSLTVNGGSGKENEKAWAHLKQLSMRFTSQRLAKLAYLLKTGGHFDAVITAIDEMTKILREEEQDDITHRDRCQGSQNKNGNDIEDAEHNIAKTESNLQRMEGVSNELKDKVNTLDGEINATGEDMATLLKMRNKESKEFVQSLADDTDAIALLNKAIVEISAFYTRNKIPLELAQKKEEPEYSIDQDKAPETVWDAAGYEGRKSETGGIVAILHMLVEDLDIEMGDARKADADAQKQYLDQNGSMQKSLDASKASKSATEVELADLGAKMNEADEYKGREGKDLEGQNSAKAALSTDCAWVETHFESRRTKRKTEIDGLTEAKAYLAGVEAGTEVA